jgi:transposase
VHAGVFQPFGVDDPDPGVDLRLGPHLGPGSAVFAGCLGRSPDVLLELAEVQDVHDLDTGGRAEGGPAVLDPPATVGRLDDRAHPRMEETGVLRHLADPLPEEVEGAVAKGSWTISDALWAEIAPLLPPEKPKPKGGRPRMPDRPAMEAIFYILRTGCQWKALPRAMGAASTVHDRFQEWVRAGVFARMWKAGLMAYDEAQGIDWSWLAMDGAMNKAPLGGALRGRIRRTGERAAPSGAS